LIRGRLLVYSVPPADNRAARFFAKRERGFQFYFAPCAIIFQELKRDIVEFRDIASAQQFVEESELKPEDMKSLIHQVAPRRKEAVDENRLQHVLAEFLVMGSIIVLKEIIRPPKSKTVEYEDVNNMPGTRSNSPPSDSEDALKDISVDFDDEYEAGLARHLDLLNGLEYTLKTDLGEEHSGVIENGRIDIAKAKMNKSFSLDVKDLPAFFS
jgi:hypothetical protein